MFNVITSTLVGTLRERTNLPLMKCKKALVETQTEYETEDLWIEAAISYLRKQGENASDKFAGRDTPNGRIGLVLNDKEAAMVLVGCQTDFVANSDVFKDLVTSITDTARVLVIDKARDAFDEKVKPLVTDAIAKLGENIVVSKVECIHAIDEVITGYNHDGKIGVVVIGTGDVQKLRQVALHVASNNPEPVAITREEISDELVNKEKEIIMALPEVMSKPDAIKEKMVTGKLNKFFGERALLEQVMLFDAEPKETVGKYCVRNNIQVNKFIKYSI